MVFCLLMRNIRAIKTSLHCWMTHPCTNTWHTHTQTSVSRVMTEKLIITWQRLPSTSFNSLIQRAIYVQKYSIKEPVHISSILPVIVLNTTYRAYNQQSMMTFLCIKIITAEIKIVLQHGNGIRKKKKKLHSHAYSQAPKKHKQTNELCHIWTACLRLSSSSSISVPHPFWDFNEPLPSTPA